jgi:fructokinase
MSKILCVGEALIDMICTDKDQSLATGQHFIKKPGGAPTNVAAAIGAMGGAVELIARVGNDAFGHQLVDVLNSFNVSTRWIIKDDKHFTTMAFVSLLENGERDFIFNRGADGYLTKDDLLCIDTADFSIVHFGSATAFLPGELQSTYQYLLQSALVNETFISFDPNYRHLLFPTTKGSFINQAWHFLDSSHFYKLSEEEAMLITNSNSAGKAADILAEKTSAVFTITLGEKGALLRHENNIEIIPGVKANVVDTTGAGDAFVGAVLYELNKFPPEVMKALTLFEWKLIVSKANKIAARTCEYVGAMEAFTSL